MRQAGAYSGLLCGGISGRTGPHSLPLARIKKIMKKSGEDVKMISGEAPIIFSKACELFIQELTTRSWIMAIQGKRRTLHKEDLASAVIATDIFDFLITLVSNSENSHAIGATTSTVMEVESIDYSQVLSNHDESILMQTKNF
ncbi:nuclear transcription factor Y subunit C-2 [Cajanus cajan]|uniref:Nuclear transcription factor Y subunit C-1 n=1 Tax=Cajanus cajan TaxID=3821 RepID=A0A151RNI3_CAJCA|nr:nuclear transcription factor Y subunit C-2 [Cajanus cajan]KYP44117.1 Nuclear transcription factor Y subunit C-1 [Cajanus cajan]